MKKPHLADPLKDGKTEKASLPVDTTKSVEIVQLAESTKVAKTVKIAESKG